MANTITIRDSHNRKVTISGRSKRLRIVRTVSGEDYTVSIDQILLLARLIEHKPDKQTIHLNQKSLSNLYYQLMNIANARESFITTALIPVIGKHATKQFMQHAITKWSGITPAAKKNYKLQWIPKKKKK